MPYNKISRLLPYLVDPFTKSKLTRDNDSLRSNENIYELRSEVPILLQNKHQVGQITSKLHKDSGTSFDYVDHYEKDADHYDYFNSHTDGPTVHENRRLHETIISEVDNGRKVILDIGCGEAWVAKNYLSRGDTVISLDISHKNVAKALKLHDHENHLGLVADLFHLPILEGSIDCIICAEVIEHVHDPALLISNLLKCLKPKGDLIITTPNDEKIEYCLCVHCNNPTPRSAHLHSFTIEKIKKIIGKNIDPSRYNKLRIFSFSNKFLTKLRTHIILKYLPWKLWKMIDSLANMIIKKPVRLFIKLSK